MTTPKDLSSKKSLGCLNLKYETIQQRKNNINMIYILGHLTKMATMPIYRKTKYV